MAQWKRSTAGSERSTAQAAQSSGVLHCQLTCGECSTARAAQPSGVLHCQLTCGECSTARAAWPRGVLPKAGCQQSFASSTACTACKQSADLYDLITCTATKV